MYPPSHGQLARTLIWFVCGKCLMKNLLISICLLAVSSGALAAKGGIPGKGGNSGGDGSSGGGGSSSSQHTISVPADMSVEATGATGAVVSFAVSTTDGAGGSVSYSCAPASGSQFSLGATQVNCTTEGKKSLRATASFTVNVNDTIAPALSVPADISAVSDDGAAVVVNYQAVATDMVSGSVAVQCMPASGSSLAVGDHTVNCSATDAAGNQSQDSFSVSVTQLLADNTVDDPVDVPVDDTADTTVDDTTTTPTTPPAPTTHSVTVNWTVPVAREDGSVLSANEIATYEIYVIGEFSGVDQTVVVSDPAATDYQLDDLADDTYYFSISAIDVNGLLSQPSDLVTVTLSGQ